jgi:AcrR family transcriptional regulator
VRPASSSQRTGKLEHGNIDQESILERVVILARVKKKPEERKAELLEAAKRLFREKGYDETSVSDIVKAVGVSQGTFYWYFDSKEDLLGAVADDFSVEYYDSLEAIATSADLDAAEKLERFFDAMENVLRASGQLLADFHTSRFQRFHDKMARRMGARVFSLAGAIVKEGVEEGIFDTSYPEEATMFIIAPGLFYHQGEIDFDDIASRRWREAHRDMTMRVLGYKGDTGKRGAPKRSAKGK